MSSPQFFIDDADPLVVYTPGWQVENNFLGAVGPGTRHGALGDNSLSATLRFRGTGIEMYGILEPQDGQPWATLYLNGQFNEAVQFAPAKSLETNLLYLGVSRLPFGDYKAVIKNENATANSLLWIDFFLIRDYEPYGGKALTALELATANHSSATLGKRSAIYAPFDASRSDALAGPVSSATNVVAFTWGLVAVIAMVLLRLVVLLYYRRQQLKSRGPADTF